MVPDNKISLFEMFLIIGDLSDEKHFDKLLTQTGYVQSLKDGSLHSKCEVLGNFGWVVSPYWKMNIDENETIIETWLNMINTNKGDDISNYFIQNDFYLLKEIINRMRFEFIDKPKEWFDEAVDNFFEEKYLSCSLILTALMERTIREMPACEWRRKVLKFFQNTIKADINRINETARKDRLNIFYEKHFYVISLGCVSKLKTSTNYASQSKADAKNTNPIKRRASFSNRMAILRLSLMRMKNISTRCLSL